MSAIDNSTNELLEDLFATLKASLKKSEINENIADTAALQAVECIKKNWGGIQIYIPKGVTQNIKLRNLKIRREFNGSNHVKLCKRYKLSLQRVYDILR